jgi:gliding motility-associated-like protein
MEHPYKKYSKAIPLFLILWIGTILSGFGQSYSLSPFSNQYLCASTYPSGYSTVNFSLNEITAVGINRNQTAKTFIVTLPAGFQFNTAAGAVSFTPAKGITSIALTSVTVSAITITVTTNADNTLLDTIYFKNFQIRATGASSGNLLRTGGTLNIGGATTNPTATESFGYLSSGVAMIYNSSAVSQYTTHSINRQCTSSEQVIMRIKINVSDTCPATITQFNFSTAGDAGSSQNPATNITRANLYYTGNDSVPLIGKNSQVFASFNSPNGAFTMNGSQQLLLGAGNYFFFLAYEVPATANIGDKLDASLTSFVFSGVTVSNMSTPNPTGTRTIIDAACNTPDMPNPPANVQTATKGSYVIPMDNTNQGLVVAGVLNLKAYGLVHSLLMNDIPVKWVILSGKAKDGVDFTDSASRVYPTAVPSAVVTFKASAFIIDSTYINKSFYSGGLTATQVITAYYAKGGRCNKVAVFKLTKDVAVNVRYTLSQRPKIACFNNGGYQGIATRMLDSAGVTNYVTINAGVFPGLSQCYTFCCEEHWDVATTPPTAPATVNSITQKVWDFVYEGGNFFAQCAGVNTYENLMQSPRHFHSTAGVIVSNTNTVASNAYYSNDMAFMQFEGTIIPNLGGTGKNWVLNRGAGSSWVNSFYHSISDAVHTDTIVAAAAHFLPADSAGGNVFYLGGHDYGATTAEGNTSTYVNGERLFLNATLVPATRPTAFTLAAGVSRNVCAGSSTTLGGSPTGPFGTTYNWSPATGLDNANAANPICTPAATTTYTVVAQNGGCPGGPSYVTVTVIPLPAAPTAAGTTICAGTTATLTATAPAGVYNWYTASSGGTLLGTGAGYTTPVLATTTTYYVDATLTGCTGPRTAVTVTVNPIPAAPTAAGTTICAGTTATLTATAPGGTYNWYTAAVAGTLLGTGASYTTPVLISNTTYYVDATVTGCTGARTAVTVTVTPIPAAPTATGTTICAGTTASVTATAPGGVYNWYDAASAGTLLATAAGYTSPVLITTTIYYVDATISGCTSARTAVTITVNPIPAAPTAAGTTICSGNTATITATAPGGTYNWYTASSGGSLLGTGAGYTSPVLAATTTYYVDATIGGCTGSRTAVTVTVTPIPAAPTAAGSTICSGNTATVTATAPGGTYNWYTAASAGTLLATAPSYTTPVLVTTTTYYVDATVTGCTGARTAVTVTVNAIPAAPTAAGTTICAGTTATVTATAPGGVYNWYTASAGGTLLATAAAYTTPVLAVTTTYYVDATIAGCTGSRTAVTITVTPIPSAPTAAGTTICAGNTATVTATAPGGTYNWYTASSGGSLLGTGAGYTTPVLAATTTYYVDATVTGCTGPRTAVTVTVNPIPAVPTASGVTICAGNTATVTATAPGGIYNWYDAASAGTLLGTGAAYTTPVLAATTIYYVDATIAGCTGSRKAVTVTVNPLAAAPTAAGTTICAGTTATVTATAPGGVYNWYTAAAGGTLLATAAAYTTPVLAATTTYYVDATIAGCTGSRTAVTITVTPIPSAPTAAGTTICAGNTATVTATAPGGTYNWYTASSGGSLLGTGAGYTTPVLAVTTTYYVDATVTGCTGPRTAVTVTVNPTPAAPTAAGAIICAGNSATVTATAPGGIYNWYDAASAGTLLGTGATYTSPVLVSTTTYYVDATIAGCAGARTAVTITVNPIPAAPTASGTTICASNSTILIATAPGGTYNWYTASSGGILLATGSGYTTPILASTTTYYVDATSSGCTGARTAVTVTVTPTPAAPTAPGATICSGSTAALTASAPGGVYQWFDAATAGTLLSTGATYTTVSLNATTTFYVQTTIAGCAGPRTAVTVTVNPIPASPTSSGKTICAGNTATLTATAPGGTYNWYDASSGGTLLATAASYTTPVLNATTTYFVDATTAGCTGTRTSVTVTVTPIPAAPSASGTTICSGNTATLTATAPGGTYAWWSAPVGGTLLVTNPSYTTPVLALTSTYYVETTVGGCLGARTPVTVTVNTTPAAPASSGVTICINTSATLTATAPGGTYNWYSAAVGGSLLGTGSSFSSPSLPANTTYYVDATINGCTGPRTAVLVTVSPVPANPAVSDTSICINTSAVLQATSPGGTYQWYDAATGGSLLFTGANFATPVLASTTLYYVQTTITGCAGSRTTVTVTVSPVPAPPSASDATICSGNSTTLTATAPGGTYNWYNASSGGTLLVTNANYTTPVLASTTLYYVSTTIGGCPGPRSTITVNVNPTPLAPVAANATICAGNTATLTATAPGGTYKWYDAATGGTLLAVSAGYTTPVLNATTSYYVDATSGLGCTGPRHTVVVTVNPVPVAPTAANATICDGSTVILHATAPGGTYNWYDAATAGTLLATNANYTTPVLHATTTYYVDATSGAGCTGIRTAVTVTVTPIPLSPIASGTTICSGNTATLTATAPGGIYQWYNAATAGILLATNPSYTSPVLITTTTYYVQSTITGCTSATRTPVTVTVNPTPAAPVSSGLTICQGFTATLIATAPGGTYNWYDAASGGTLLATNASFTTPTLNSTTSYYVDATSGAGCTGPRKVVTVTVTPSDNPAFSYPSGTYCFTGTNPSPTITGGSTGTFSATPAGLVFVSTSNGTINLSGSALGSYTVKFVTNGACIDSSTVSLTITNSPNANFSYIGPYCQKQANPLPGFIAGASAGLFSSVPVGLVFVSNSTGEIDLSASAAGVYTLTNNIAAAGGCAAATATNTVTINQVATVSAGSDQTVCAGSTVTMAGTKGGGASSATWSGGLGSFSNASLLNAVYTPDPSESTVKLYLTTNDPAGPCGAVKDSMNIFINPIPASPAASGSVICQGTAATLSATAPGGTYAWYDAATAGTLLITGANYSTPVLNSTTTYYVQTTQVGCTSPRTAVIVTVNPTPALPTVAGATICSGNTATLTATAPGGTYDWYNAASGGALLMSAASYTTPVLSATTPYYVQSTIAGCAGPRTTVTVTVNPIPAAPTAFDATICSGNTATLTATAPGGTYDWYSASSGGTLLISGAAYTSPVLSAPAVYYVQATISGCTGPRTAVTVNVNPIPASPSVLGATICSGNSVALTATAPGGTYEWYDAAVAGTLLISSANYNTPVLNANASYYVQTTVTGCTSARTTVNVIVNPIPAAVTAIGTTICAGNSTTLTATAPGGTYDWYDAGSGGTLLVTNTSYTTPILNTTTSYYVQSTIAGCTGSRAAVTVTVNPIPAAPSAANRTICDGSKATLTATAPGGTYDWFDAATAGTLLGTGTNYTTPVLNANATYYVQSTIAGCTGARTSVNVTVNPIPVAPTASGTTICQGFTATLSASAPAGTYQWYSAVSGGISLMSSASYTTPALNSTTTYYVQANAGGCGSVRTGVTVTVTPTDNASFSYPSSTYCISGANPVPAVTGGFPGAFSSSPAGLVFVSTTTGEINISASSLNTYTVTYTTSGPCPASSSTNITITNAPDATFSYSGPYCHAGLNPSPVFVAGASAGTFSAIPAGLVFVNANTGVVNMSLSVPGTYTVTNNIAAAGGCASATATNTITINTTATVFAGNDQTICAGSTVTLAGTIGGSASTGTWTGGAGSFAPDNTTLNAAYTPTAAEVSAGKVTLVLSTDDPSGPCNAVSDTVKITINTDNPAFTYSSGTYCASGANPSPTVTGLAGGTFSAAPAGLVFVSTATGQVNVGTSSPGTYNITYTTNGTCPNSASHSITITTSPDASFSYAGPFCTKAVNPLPSFPAGASAGIFASSPTGLVFIDTATGEIDLGSSTAGTYSISNSIAASAGCIAATSSFNVTIDPKATVNAGGNQSVCVGATVSLNGTIGGSATAATWTGGAGSFAPNNTALNATYTPAAGETLIQLILTTNDPAGPCNATADTVSIQVNPIPAAPTASGTTICSGSTATLMATAPGGIYNWYNAVSGGSLLVSNASYTTPALSTPTDYYVQTTVLGCTSSRSTVSVAVNPIPAPVSANGTTICAGNSTTLTATAPGGTYDWYDAASGGTLLITNASYTTPVLNTTATYYVQSTIAGCTGARVPVTVTVNPIPAAPALSNATICDGTTATLTATAPGGTYDWYDAAVAGTLLGSGINYTTPVLNANATYYVQSTMAGCSGPRTTVNVTVNPIPVAPAASGTTICQGSAATLTAAAASGTYQWYTAASGGLLLINSSSYTTPSLNATATYYVQVTAGGCGSVRTAVTVTVTPTDNPSFSYPTATYCTANANPVPALTGGFPGVFSSKPAGLVFVSTTTGEINISASALNTYTVSYLTSGPCPASDSASITITNAPDATFSYSGPYCHSASNPAPVFIAGASAGTFSAIPAGLVFVNANSGVINLSLSTPGTYTVTNTISAGGGCAGATASSAVTINLAPTVFAGNDQSICAGSVVSLSGTIGGSASTGTWTGGAGLFAPSNATLNAAYTPTAAEISAGKVTLVLNTDDPSGPCNAVSDTVVITIKKDDPSFSYAAGTYCISGANPVPVITGLAGGTFSSSPGGLAFVSTSTGEVNVVTSALGTYTITYTTNGSCASWTSHVITIAVAPDASFAYAGPFCPKQTNPIPSFPVGASAGVFSVLPAGLIFANTATGEIDLTASTAGTYTITNSIAASGGCAAETASFSVTINPRAIANAGPDQSVCAGSAVSLNGSLGGSATAAVWTGGAGTFAPANTSLNATYTPAAGETSITLYLTTNDPAGPCNAVTDTLVITVNPLPTSPTAVGTTICSGTTATLTATAPGGNYEWYSASTGGTLLASAASYTTPVLTAPATYYVQTIISGCSSARTSVGVTVNPAPVLNAGRDTILCSGSSNLLLNGTASGAVGILWTTSGSGSFTPNDTTLAATYNPGPTDIAAGKVNLVLVSEHNGLCAAVTDTMTLHLISPAQVHAGSDTTICRSGGSLNGSIINGSGTGIWSSTNGTGTFSPANTSMNAIYLPSAADALKGTVTLVLTSTNNGSCSASTDTVKVTIMPAATANAGTDQTVCSNSPSVTLAGAFTGTAGAFWKSTGKGIFSDSTVMNASYTLDTADISKGAVTLVLSTTGNGNCTAASDSMTIFITPASKANAGADQTVCKGISSVVLNGTVSGTTGKWSGTGTGVFLPNDSTLNATYHLSALDTAAGSVKLILTTTHTGFCGSSSDTMLIKVLKTPLAVNAGTDQFACSSTAIQLSGTVIGAGTSYWKTTGTGTFSPDSSKLNAVYTPGTADLLAGSVKLILLSNNACQTGSDTVKITLGHKPVAGFSSVNGCKNNGVHFTDTSKVTGNSIISWAWNFGDGGTANIQNPTHNFPSQGSYTVDLIVTSGSGCTDTVRSTVTPSPGVVADFTTSANTYSAGEPITFTNNSTGASSWEWNFGDANTSSLQNPTHTYGANGTYNVTLTASNLAGCTDTISKTFTVDGGTPVAVPTAFTPNGDGVNDVLYVRGGPFKEFEFRIFNEWGNEIFSSRTKSAGWDGKLNGQLQTRGSYVWTVTGITIDNKVIKMAGGVTLIR